MAEKTPHLSEFEKNTAETGKSLLPEHVKLTPEAAAQEAAVDKESRLAQAEAAIESSGAETAINPLKRLEVQDRTEAEETGPSRHIINNELKTINKQQGLQRIRHKLSPTHRTLSRIIHQPLVRVISETAGKTISRPSGLLGGGLVAFLGGSIYLYATKHSGSSYNYLAFLLLFAGGFIVGLLLELVVYTALVSVRHRND